MGFIPCVVNISLHLILYLIVWPLYPLSLCFPFCLLCSLYLWVCFFFVIFIRLLYFIDSTHKWIHTVFAFLWLISLGITPSKSIHVATNGNISFLFYSWVLVHCVCVCVCVCLAIHLCWWIFRLLPYLGNCEQCCYKHWGCTYLFKLDFFVFFSDICPGV